MNKKVDNKEEDLSNLSFFLLPVSGEAGQVKCKQLWRNPSAFYRHLAIGCGSAPALHWTNVNNKHKPYEASGHLTQIIKNSSSFCSSTAEMFLTTKVGMRNLLPSHKQGGVTITGESEETDRGKDEECEV